MLLEGYLEPFWIPPDLAHRMRVFNPDLWYANSVLSQYPVNKPENFQDDKRFLFGPDFLQHEEVKSWQPLEFITKDIDLKAKDVIEDYRKYESTKKYTYDKLWWDNVVEELEELEFEIDTSKTSEEAWIWLKKPQECVLTWENCD